MFRDTPGASRQRSGRMADRPPRGSGKDTTLDNANGSFSLLLDYGKGIRYLPFMIATSKLTRKNQTTLPRSVLNALGLKPADRIVYEVEGDQVTLRAKTGRLVDLVGRFARMGRRPRRPATVEVMQEAIAAGWAAHGRRGAARSWKRA